MKGLGRTELVCDKEWDGWIEKKIADFEIFISPKHKPKTMCNENRFKVSNALILSYIRISHILWLTDNSYEIQFVNNFRVRMISLKWMSAHVVYISLNIHTEIFHKEPCYHVEKHYFAYIIDSRENEIKKPQQKSSKKKIEKKIIESNSEAFPLIVSAGILCECAKKNIKETHTKRINVYVLNGRHNQQFPNIHNEMASKSSWHRCRRTELLNRTRSFLFVFFSSSVEQNEQN